MGNRRVLVTGASKGIGKAIALQLAKDGFDIAIHYNSDKTGAESVLKQIQDHGGHAHLLQFDISSREKVKIELENDIKEFGAYYGVICNAGVARDGSFPMLSDDDWDTVLRTNLDGFFNVVHPCVMPMVRAGMGGRIITMSSVSGVMGNRGQVNYSASKAGIIGASKALAIELAKRKITVNCIAPGLIETDMITAENFENAKSLIPMGRMGSVEEVAALTSYLMSDMAGYMTRQVLSLNGGMV